MFSLARTALAMRKVRYSALVATFASMGLVSGAMISPVVAAPAHDATGIRASAQNVDWMSTDTALSLDVGMDVLVPTWIPEPFAGYAPSISAGGGYYQVYWMIPGGAPTFLYIEGVAGGSLPAGSPADLNKPLTVNASVQGWEAIHDIGIPAGGSTPIYDQVWWVANGVLYTVSSNNMTGYDSLSLANSLVSLQAPAPAPVEVPTEPIVVPTDPPVIEEPVVTEPEVVEKPAVEAPVVEAPEVEAPVDDEPVASEPEATEVIEDVVVSEDPRVVDTSTVAPVRQIVTDVSSEAESTETPAEDDAASENIDSGVPWSPDPTDTSIPSDGTSGPVPPVIGGDGTGGVFDNALPLIMHGPRLLP